MRRLALAATATLMLAACGGSPANNTAEPGNDSANAAAARATSDLQNRVRDLDVGARNGLLIRAIRDAGQDCQSVERSELMQTSNNVPVYMATCDGGAVYAVAIRDDGQAVVQPAMREEGQ